MTGAELIAAERERQVRSEGWTSGHDATHKRGELAMAAACYLLHETGNVYFHPAGGMPPMAWPWQSAWWKPKDRMRDLVKAGALIAAEIDRLRATQDSAQAAVDAR